MGRNIHSSPGRGARTRRAQNLTPHPGLKNRTRLHFPGVALALHPWLPSCAAPRLRLTLRTRPASQQTVNLFWPLCKDDIGYDLTVGVLTKHPSLGES